MTSNKPEVVAYLHINKENPEHRGASLRHDMSCTNTLINTEPLICLSDYEALQVKCVALIEALEAVVFFHLEVKPNDEWLGAHYSDIPIDGVTICMMRTAFEAGKSRNDSHNEQQDLL